MMSQVDPNIAREFSQFGPVWLLLGTIVVAGLVAGYFIVKSWTSAASMVATAHKEFLDSTRVDLKTMAQAYNKQTELQGQQTEILRELKDTSQRIEDKLDRRRDG